MIKKLLNVSLIGKCIETSNKTVLSILLYNMLLIKIAESSVFSFANQIKYEKFIETQKHLIKNMDSYIDDIPKSQNSIVKKYIYRYQRENAIAMKNVSVYLANPLNCYVLVKSVSHDLSYVEDILTQYTDYVRPKNLLYSTDKDYETALTLIAFLVYVYDLNVTELANGNLTGYFRKDAEKFTEITTPLTSSDCFELALATYEHGEYDTSLTWIKQALRKYPRDCNRNCPFTDLDITQFIRRTYFVKDRLISFDSLSMDEVSKTGGSTNGNKEAVFKQFKDQHVSVHEKMDENDSRKIQSKWMFSKRKLCWREHVNRSSLSCQYRYGPHPFLRLARFKTELLHRNPDVTLFYDVISDEEFQALRNLTEKQVKKAGPGSYITQGKILRQVSYIYDNASPVAMRLSQRALDISGLNSTFTDNFKMMHYGAAGYFSPHTDCLSYLSEANLGGATAFLHLNMSMFPERRAALMFNTVLPSGEVNNDTLHGSCPVLHGSKWVITEWLTATDEENSFQKWINQPHKTVLQCIKYS